MAGRDGYAVREFQPLIRDIAEKMGNPARFECPPTELDPLGIGQHSVADHDLIDALVRAVCHGDGRAAGEAEGPYVAPLVRHLIWRQSQVQESLRMLPKIKNSRCQA